MDLRVQTLLTPLIGWRAVRFSGRRVNCKYPSPLRLTIVFVIRGVWDTT